VCSASILPLQSKAQTTNIYVCCTAAAWQLHPCSRAPVTAVTDNCCKLSGMQHVTAARPATSPCAPCACKQTLIQVSNNRARAAKNLPLLQLTTASPIDLVILAAIPLYMEMLQCSCLTAFQHLSFCSFTHCMSML
jgi:hypothetical protein